MNSLQIQPRQSRWCKIPLPLRSARLRLICFPHAGAGASIYYHWRQPLRAQGIELAALQYPGREERVDETPIASFREMVAALVAAWDDIAGTSPCAVFGHSIGAMLAFELVLELSRRPGANVPLQLYASGRNPPHIPPQRANIAHLPDEAFIAALISEYKGAIPDELLADPEMRALITRTLRADVAANESYAVGRRPPIDIPIHAFGGYDDCWTSAESLQAWSEYSTRASSIRMFKGDHFFHQSGWSEVVANVLKTLRPHFDPPGA